MKKNLIYILFFSFAFYIFWKNTDFKENVHQWYFDFQSGQKIITSHQDISEIFESFPTSSIDDFEKDYLSKTKYKLPKYKKLAKDANFLIIKGKDIFKYIVGDFRIKDFLPKDGYYYDNIDALGEGQNLIWAIDIKLLYKLLDLQEELLKKGMNETGFTIVNGFRHPAYNEKVGGAKLSRHLIGQALDLQINDINNDGYEDQVDKKIVLDILENSVIKDSGGIGKYPGTMSVHFDVRGFRSRWDSH